MLLNGSGTSTGCSLTSQRQTRRLGSTPAARRQRQHGGGGGGGGGAAAPRLAPRRGDGANNAQRAAALSGIPDGETPPYALLSTPVYSLSSRAADDGDDGSNSATLNMITYASPIALRPQRKYALGLYVQSLTYANVKRSGRAVLQILRRRHAPLTQLLGKTSGRDVDKVAELRRRGFRVADAYGLPVLADALGVMELRVASEFVPAGDHEVVVCDVTAWRLFGGAEEEQGGGGGGGETGAAAKSERQQGADDGEGDVGGDDALYTGYLREHGFLP